MKNEEYPLYESVDDIIEDTCPDIKNHQKRYIKMGIESYIEEIVKDGIIKVKI